nr:UNC93-like protein MFSD11 [Lytechinus pictus]
MKPSITSSEGSCGIEAQDQGETLLYHQQRYDTQNTQLESKGSKCTVTWKLTHDDFFFILTVRSAKLMLKKEMLIISITNFYTGLELTFFSGVYGTAISNTKMFGVDSNSFIGISGMLIGAGEITGGLLFGILGKKTIKFGRDPIILLGYVVHMICFYLIFLNLPHISLSLSFSIELAFACSYMLGFADACFNTQIYSLLGSYFKSDSASAFALFKFIQSAAAAIAFAYSLVLVLHWQLLILVVCGTFGALSFFYVEHHPPRNEI